MHTVVIDCPDPAALAAFYADLVGWPVVEHDEDRCVLDSGTGSRLAFQRSPQSAPPTWPDPTVPQQVHLDIAVDDIAVAEERVLALGARPLPGGEADFRVYADPAGHPFCLEFTPV